LEYLERTAFKGSCVKETTLRRPGLKNGGKMGKNGPGQVLFHLPGRKYQKEKKESITGLAPVPMHEKTGARNRPKERVPRTMFNVQRER
jgi:hypothetical protein